MFVCLTSFKSSWSLYQFLALKHVNNYHCRRGESTVKARKLVSGLTDRVFQFLNSTSLDCDTSRYRKTRISGLLNRTPKVNGHFPITTCRSLIASTEIILKYRNLPKPSEWKDKTARIFGRQLKISITLNEEGQTSSTHYHQLKLFHFKKVFL